MTWDCELILLTQFLLGESLPFIKYKYCGAKGRVEICLSLIILSLPGFNTTVLYKIIFK